ncbi:RNA 2'-phosphotransferase [Intestinibacter sp.]
MDKDRNNDKKIKSLSKFISKILRHEPEIVHINLDDNGYTDVQGLIDGINKYGRNKIDFKTLKYIVENDNKQRYSFKCDFTKIRANQGHSIDVDLGLEEIKPPNNLYHGTGQKYLDSILEEGIKSQTRQFIHLSKDTDTARNVGSRHGKPRILKIDTKQMYDDGYKFYLSENNVWMTKYVPTKYIWLV